MGSYNRNDWSAGWQPSADAFNAPKNALLRADNLVLEETGIIALRQGSNRVNATALAEQDVHSLFWVVIGGTPYRLAGAGNSVYSVPEQSGGIVLDNRN